MMPFQSLKLQKRVEFRYTKPWDLYDVMYDTVDGRNPAPPGDV